MKFHHPDNRNIAQQCARRAVLSKSILCSFADLLTFQLICRKEKPSFSWYFDYSRTELNASLSGIPRLIPQDRAECDDVGRVGWTPTWKVENTVQGIRWTSPSQPTSLIWRQAANQNIVFFFSLICVSSLKICLLDNNFLLFKHIVKSNFK